MQLTYADFCKEASGSLTQDKVISQQA